MDAITLALAKRYSDSKGACLPVVELSTDTPSDGSVVALSDSESAQLNALVEACDTCIIKMTVDGTKRVAPAVFASDDAQGICMFVIAALMQNIAIVKQNGVWTSGVLATDG